MQPRFEIVGSRRANSSLQRYFDNIKSWPQATAAIFQYLQDGVEQAFASEGRAGVRWPDYWVSEHQYGMMKMSIFENSGQGGLFPGLLQWLPGNERLKPSLLSAQHPDAIRKVTNDGIEYGTAVPYAYRHQYGVGTNEQGEKIQQRKFLILVAEDVAQIRRIIARHVGI